ncbi:MAG: Xaa-Pro peptidase family protein [Bacillota bacterium]|nr:Xaa-Pro peptidase family protein [Bacillota bacterium]
MVPREELYNRIGKLQKSMQKKEIAGALIIQRADLFYFSGTGQNAHLYVPADGEPVLIVKKSLVRAEQESAIENIIPFRGWNELIALIADMTPKGSKVGLETDVLPFNLYNRYQKMLDEFSITDISPFIRAIRALKSKYELNTMREAAGISEAVFTHAREIIHEGLSEIELAGRLELKARTLGHQGAVRMRGFNQELYFGHIMTGENAATVSFFDGPTGGSGLNPSYPQGAGKAVIKPNEPILIDFVSVLDGYMVDQTRLFCIGGLKPHLQEAYNQAVKIRNALATEGKPGILGSTLYTRADELATGAGLANHFMGYTERVNFVGHGVGIELDELPVIARGLDILLEEGMVFALEPKFIFPGEGTVGIEDTFVVGCDRLELLTRFSEGLQVI